MPRSKEKPTDMKHLAVDPKFVELFSDSFGAFTHLLFSFGVKCLYLVELCVEHVEKPDMRSGEVSEYGLQRRWCGRSR